MNLQNPMRATSAVRPEVREGRIRLTTAFLGANKFLIQNMHAIDVLIELPRKLTRKRTAIMRAHVREGARVTAFVLPERSVLNK